MKQNKKSESIFAKRGFFIGMVVVVATMVILLTMNLIMPDENQDTFDEVAWEDALRQSAGKTDDYNEEAQSVNADAVPEPAEGLEPLVPEDEKSEETQETATEPATESDGEEPDDTVSLGNMVMENPVPGSIAKDFSSDELVYSDTMQDWRVHEGIDFAAEENTEVKAAADGKIEEVIKDGMLGACVIISHDGGIKTLYANLQEESLPVVGSPVKAGEVIGKVGRTAALEINDSPHLHFEVMENDTRVNPHLFLQDTVTDDE